VRALHRKLLRDLWGIKSQALAIGAVIAVGVMVFTMYLSTFRSLRLTQETYYERNRFAEVFAGLKRAPRSLLPRVEAIPGVGRVDARVVAQVTLDVPEVEEPATGMLISVPVPDRATLNDVVLTGGRYLEPGRAGEVLVSEGFALANELEPGDSVAAILNGRRQELEIVGIALSPEYVYAIRPGDLFPDDRRFGIFWMQERALANAFDMEGAFNDLALTLERGASEAEVIARLDRLLERYGGLGAVPRRLQTSHWYLESELVGLQTVGMIVPVIFLVVAAFLLNVVLGRIVAVQREQIAALKALGYSDREVGLHYVAWGLVIAGAGMAAGVGCGAWLGHFMVRMYNDYFRFPVLRYRLDPEIAVGVVAVALAAAVVGAYFAVRRAVRLPPAEAMRPEPPAAYRRSWIDLPAMQRLLPPAARMVLRNLQRRPARAAASVVGIAFSAAMLVSTTFFFDAFDEMIAVAFGIAQRQDMTVSFVEPVGASALHEIERLPGVLDAEPMRSVPARLRHGPRSRQVGILGLVAEPRLNRLVDAAQRPVRLPEGGLVLSDKLARTLGAETGDTLVVEVLEGERPVRRVPVVRVVEEYLGSNAYMEIGSLRRMMGEGGSLSGAFLSVDEARSDELYRRLKRTPKVAGVNLQREALRTFQKTIDETMGVFLFFNVLFAGVIAFGVVYNAARVSLSERSRELASLRVLGFHKREIAAILLGELALLTLVALPLGLVIGYGLADLIVRLYDTELYRFPLVILPRTYALACLTVVAAATLSGLVVRRRLGRLDLVAVLKTRE
jgi:putative ABC transport system permease protein